MRNILDFEEDFPEVTTVVLDRNYRSTQVILDAASSVISHNRGRKDKRLWTERAGGDAVVYHRAHDELEEADYVVSTLRQALTGSADGVAVLYRTNAQSRAIEDTLTREGIAYRVVGGVRFYERKEIKDALSYLKLMLNPDDDVSLRRVINVPARGIGKGVMEALEQVEPAATVPGPLFAGTQSSPPASGPSLWNRLGRALGEGLVATRALSALGRFRDLMTSLSAIAKAESASVTLAKTLDQTGYLEALRSAGTEEAESRLANLLELVSAARDYEVRDPDASLTGFVDRLSLLSEADEAQGPGEARVSLMTLHASKGLEFPLVIIAGMEDGLFPHARSADDNEELGGGAPLVLRRHDPGAVAARPHQRRPAPRLRRVPILRAVAVHRRDLVPPDRGGGTRVGHPALRAGAALPANRRVSTPAPGRPGYRGRPTLRFRRSRRRPVRDNRLSRHARAASDLRPRHG